MTAANSTEQVNRPSRRNFRLTVWNGGIVVMGTAFFAPDTVLASFAKTLTDSTLCVGLLVSMGGAGWMWPQIFVGPLVEPLSRKLPLYTTMAVLRFSMLIAMAATIFLWSGSWLLLFWIVLGLYALFASSGGVVGVPFMDIVGKTIPKRDMAMLWGYRRMLGGLLGFLATFVVGFILSERSGVPFPTNYAVLMLLGALVCGAAYGLFMGVREPVEEVTDRRVSFWTFLKRGPVIFRNDPDFRRFFILRATWAFGRMSQLALFVPMAIELFNATPRITAGWFTAIVLLAGGVSSFAWGRVARRYGEIFVMRIGVVLMLLAPLTALVLAVLARVDATAGFAQRHYLAAYVVMYLCATTSANACDISGMVYLLALPSARLRPTYVAFMNTLYVPLLFAPTLAGFLAERVSYTFTFGLSCIASVVAFVVASRLRPRTEADAPDLDFGEEA
ncbi:MAG: MFS transporter [bacterium]|nr:MFS transporter [bacterium]